MHVRNFVHINKLVLVKRNTNLNSLTKLYYSKETLSIDSKPSKFQVITFERKYSCTFVSQSVYTGQLRFKNKSNETNTQPSKTQEFMHNSLLSMFVIR